MEGFILFIISILFIIIGIGAVIFLGLPYISEKKNESLPNSKEAESPLLPNKFVLHQLGNYAKEENYVNRYQMMIEDAMNLYGQVQALASVSNSESIIMPDCEAPVYRMVEIFQKKIFTLAVLGKRGVGKSMLINALLQEKELLPMGVSQKTSPLIVVQYGEKKKLRVKYKNTPEDVYTEDVEKNLVNCLKNHPDDKVPMALIWEYPLRERFRRWRFVEALNIDTINGMDNETKQFLYGSADKKMHVVDAIVAVQSVQQMIENKFLKEFIAELQFLTAEERKKTFVVLTHATVPLFLQNGRDFNNVIQESLVAVGFNHKQVTVVDSIVSLLGDAKLDFESFELLEKPMHWNSDEWEHCRKLLERVLITLKDDGREINNENILRELHKLANLMPLRTQLDNYAQGLMKTTCGTIINSIRENINIHITNKEQIISILEKERADVGTKIKGTKQDEQNLEGNRGIITNKIAEKEKEVQDMKEQVSEIDKTMKEMKTAISKLEKEEKNIDEKIEKEKDNMVPLNQVLNQLDSIQDGKLA